jgi:hypothetical protein
LHLYFILPLCIIMHMLENWENFININLFFSLICFGDVPVTNNLSVISLPQFSDQFHNLSWSNQLKCEICISALQSSENNKHHKLIEQKNKGGLIFPSKDVVRICTTCEKVFKHNETISKFNGMKINANSLVASSICLGRIYWGKSIRKLVRSYAEQYPSENHLIHLMREICQTYFNIRLKYCGKSVFFTTSCKRIRNTLQKIILFQGQ